MKNIILCLIFLPFICLAEDEGSFPEGRWEGFQDLGIGGNASFIMYIDSKGNGFYGYSLKGQKDGSVCMPISKTTMQKRTGYYEQINRVKDLQFVVIFTEQLLNNNFKAMSLFLTNQNRSYQTIVWSIVPVANKFLNQEVEQACNEKLKAT